MITPILLCGGSGTRLWPLSRKGYPKQFAKLTENKSLFQASALRLSGDGFAAPMVVTSNDCRFIVTEQLATVGIVPAATVIEPEARNTAPAILASALILEALSPGNLMLVAPSDHLISDADGFRATVRAAVPAARDGQLVTFGIRPDRMGTGDGSLAMSASTANFAMIPHPLQDFVKKSGGTMDEAMREDGAHRWGTGIFLLTSDAIIAAFAADAPAMLEQVRAAVDDAEHDLGFIRLALKPWTEAEAISIECAVMEKTDNLKVVPFGGEWSDLGDWDAVWRKSDPDKDGVVTSGPATALDCQDTLLRAEDDKQVLVGIGLRDVIVVAMPDAVLVTHKDRVQDVKNSVAALKARKVVQAERPLRDYRPWGWFECLAMGGRFQVKRIHVHPGAALSLQNHHHRSEHWIVVEGTAKVTVNDKVSLISENESVYVPLGALHRLENPGKLPMVLIEVQTGSYLGEDDILRYEDVYSRV